MTQSEFKTTYYIHVSHDLTYNSGRKRFNVEADRCHSINNFHTL